MNDDQEKTSRPNIEAEQTTRPTVAENTVRPEQAEGVTVRPGQEEVTVRSVHREEVTFQESICQFTEYELNGTKYQVIKPISERTGEAQVFLVENNGKKFALKLYKVNYHPDENVLKIIHNKIRENAFEALSKEERDTIIEEEKDAILSICKEKNLSVYNAISIFTTLLVDTLEYGIWTNPTTQEKRDYELMVYYEGGSLSHLVIPHNEQGEKMLCKIIIRCATALDILHKEHIIHRDVKPANFFFRTNKQSINSIALADFGIAIPCAENGFVKFKGQWRTRIYTAPEYYDTVQEDNGTFYEIDTKSDFFALGMTMLTLWCGEEVFLKYEDEFKLKNKKKFGELPYPEDVSDRTLQLMKALTHPNFERRAGIEDIIKWKNGENIYDLGQRKEDIRVFRISFTKDKIAYSPKELAQFMFEDKELAKKYLYQGKIEKWLADNDRNELTTEIYEITEKIYSNNQEAGLYAACYSLDKDLPYIDVKNKVLNSKKEIAISLQENFEHYEKALSDPHDSLFLFFNARGLGNITNTFGPLFKKGGDNCDTLLQLIQSMDPTFTIDKNETIYYENGDWKKGRFINGKLHGFGTSFFATIKRKDTGEYKYGARTGKGKMEWESGQWYSGDWSNDGRNGKGEERYPNGNWKEGKYVNDIFEEGKYYYYNGNWEEGHFLNNELHGYGTKYSAEYKRKDIGEYENGTRTGKGKMEWESGHWYVGGWNNNGRNGMGEYHYPNGDYQKGNFDNGKFRSGKYSHKDGNYYEGNFDDNLKLHGEGTFYDAKNKRKYIGTYENGVCIGKGKIIYEKTGIAEEGEWDEHGVSKGKRIFPDGSSEMIGNTESKYKSKRRRHEKLKRIFKIALLLGIVVFIALYYFRSDLATWFNKTFNNDSAKQTEGLLTELSVDILGLWRGTLGNNSVTLEFLGNENGIEAKITLPDNKTKSLRATINGNQVDLKNVVINGNYDGDYSGTINVGATLYEGTYTNLKTRRKLVFKFEKKISESSSVDKSTPNVFPFIGNWKLTGKDSYDNWTADLTIESKNGNTFSGYFAWYSSGNYRGKEYYSGEYNPNSKTVVLKGTKLENSRNLALGTYNASINGNNFESGTWGGGIPGTWRAAFSTINKDIASSNVGEEKGVIIKGIRWATRNVDKPGTFAKTPESAGMFYQWNRKTGWSTTDPLINSNGGTTWDHSQTTGTRWKEATDPCPSGWRLPTLPEIQGLIGIGQWTTINGTSGRRFTDPNNGNSIFLPAAGVRYSDGVLQEKNNGYYRTSWLQGNNPAAYFILNSSGDGWQEYHDSRDGMCIRCVAKLLDETKSVTSADMKESQQKDQNTQEAVNFVQDANATFNNTNLGSTRYDQSFQLYKKAKELGGDVSIGYYNFLSLAKLLIENGAGFDAHVKKMLQYAQQLNNTQEVRDLLSKCN